MAKEYYQARIDGLNHKIAELDHKSKRFLWMKIFTFFSGVAALILYWNDFGNLWLYTGIGLLVLYIYALTADSRILEAIGKCKALRFTCKKELDGVNGDFSHFDDGRKYVDANHPFTFDLDIFGTGSLFQRINRTISNYGERLLAAMLSTVPLDKETIISRNEAIKELCGSIDWCIDFLSLPRVYLHKIGNDHRTTPSGVFIAFQILGTICTISLIVATVLSITLIKHGSGLSWLIFGILFGLQLLASVFFKSSLMRKYSSGESMHSECAKCLVILETITKADFTSTLLKEKQTSLNNAAKPIHELGTLSKYVDMIITNVFLYILTNGLFSFNALLLRRYEKWMEDYSDSITDWYKIAGEIDALVSCGVFAFNNSLSCYATINTDNGIIAEAARMRHPFIPADIAVTNDFTLYNDEIALITGANMAGKSTFLRCFGVNYLLASIGLPVFAESFGFRIASLFTSMRTSDNLVNSKSYFQAELLRLKELYHACKKNDYTVIILDEILKGTNSKDKLQGSLTFLRHLMPLPCAGLVATHDLELSRLEEESKQISNYKFEIELTNPIKYDYKISPGIAKNLNATFLLKEMLDDCQQ